MALTAQGDVKVMAHRGGRHGGAPNSIAAITHACDVGAQSVEIDVNETIDGVLVATHDALAGGLGWIAEQSYTDLVASDPEEWSHRRLEDVVGYALSRSTVAYLDLKAVSPPGLKRIAAIYPAATKEAQVIFATARGDIVAWLGTNIPAASTSFLYYDRLLDLKSLSGFMLPNYVHPCFDHLREPFRSIDEAYIDRARSLGFKLVSWSENDPERVGQLANLGFEFICTDEPELALGAIETANS